MVIARPRQVFVDAALAGGLCVLDLLLSSDPSRSSGPAGGAFTPLYAAAGYVLLLWRRRYPGWVLAAMVVHSLLAWVFSHAYVPALGVWLALYTIAALRGRRVALIGLAGAMPVAALTVADIVEKQFPDNKIRALVVSATGLFMLNVAIFALGRWAGWSVRQRRLVAERAAIDAVRAERDRIARDLHDIVAHAVTLMVLQAGGAARLLRREPSRAEEALRHVDELGQQAIVELRHMLGLLTTTADAGPDTPGRLADIASIIDHIDTEDVQVDLTTTGEPVRLDASVDVSAYRVVREALTNVIRYGDHRFPVQVGLLWRADAVEITVVNHISLERRSRSSAGHGLIGMRERAQAAGGCFWAGRTPDGRFAVRVTLPTATHQQNTSIPADNAMTHHWQTHHPNASADEH